jgi:hypothetical protein
MIRTILALLLLIAPLAAQVTLKDLDAAREAMRPFLDALAQVESGGKDDAVGDRGKALGRYQIWRVYHTDAVAHAPCIGGAYKDVTSKEYAERIVVAYLMRYASQAIKDQDWKKLARIHNGGPRGHTKWATLSYWRKVEKALASD